MALAQSGAAGGKLLILIGAGVTGSYLLNHTQLSDLLSDLSKVLSKHLKDNGDDGGGDNDGATAALTAQVRKLTQELRQLASAQGRPIIVNSDGRGSRGGLWSMVLPMAAVGAVGYGYLRWKGWRLGDLMYVTKKSMAAAVHSVTEQMEGLGKALAATKRQITHRLDRVDKTLDENVAITRLLHDKADKQGLQLGNVEDKVLYLQGDVTEMKDQLTTVASKQDFANQGIYLLCRFVVDGLPMSGAKPELVQGLHAYTRAPMVRSISTNTGLKAIEDLMDKIEPSTKPPLPTAGANDENFSMATPPRPFILTRASSARR